jgi:hypothetical protein
MSRDKTDLNRNLKTNAEQEKQVPDGDVLMAETSPNPHGEAKVTPVPVKTDQAYALARQNVAQTPSMRDGRLHPSVAESTEGGVADHDSMFNNADLRADRSGLPSQRNREHHSKRRDDEKKPA